MDKLLALLNALPAVFEVVERHPFAAVVLLALAWLVVEGIKARRRR